MTTKPTAAPEKVTWTDADFDRMGWHDAALHAVAVEPASEYPGRLLLDLDYIIEWIAPVAPNTAYSFWLCPATLVFKRASDLVADLSLLGQAFESSVDSLVRSDPDAHGHRTWTIEGHEFTVRLRSPGFTQYLRRRPIFSNRQRLTVDERGGVGFDERSYE